MASVGELLAMAEAAVDEAEAIFHAGFGAPDLALHDKGNGDFATTADLAIEQRVRHLLVHMTGVEVYGEESTHASASPTRHGELPHTGAVWVVDPIDGTSNFAAQNPNCGILVALVHDLQPVAAVVSFPKLALRMAATDGGGVRGLPVTVPHPQRHVGVFSQTQPELYTAIRHRGLRPRVSGSVGLDLAYAARGVLSGAINYSPHPWDNAAGALLVREAGGIVTTPEGDHWDCTSRGIIVGDAATHAQLLDAAQSLDR